MRLSTVSVTRYLPTSRVMLGAGTSSSEPDFVWAGFRLVANVSDPEGVGWGLQNLAKYLRGPQYATRGIRYPQDAADDPLCFPTHRRPHRWPSMTGPPGSIVSRTHQRMTGQQPTSPVSSASPLVSILVPSYNGARYLREALNSILAQSYSNIEVILLDDASTDETPSIADEYTGRIEYIRQPTNLGIYDNVNFGIARSRGDLIATYHADDIYLPTIVEAQVAYLTAHPEVGAVFCADIFVDAEGREYNRLVLPTEVSGDRPLDYATVLNTLLTYKNRFLVCPTAMIRSAVHRDVGVYRQSRYRNTADLEMWLRIARRYPIAVLESHLMKYRHFHGNSSQRYHRLRTAPENFFVILDEYLAAGDRALATGDALVEYEAHRSEDRLMAAISHYIRKEMVEGRSTLRDVDLGAIMGASVVQRWRLLLIAIGMWGLLRLPRSDRLAQRMHNRWHVKRPPASTAR
jgi:glycosyltransferase involved in cell wall biosynthesis